jgi:hypothetical protein
LGTTFSAGLSSSRDGRDLSSVEVIKVRTSSDGPTPALCTIPA